MTSGIYASIGARLKPQLRRGKYRFQAQRRYRIEGQVVDVWHAQDALVLKALALVLQASLPKLVQKYCYHCAGTGGIKGGDSSRASSPPELSLCAALRCQTLLSQHRPPMGIAKQMLSGQENIKATETVYAAQCARRG